MSTLSLPRPRRRWVPLALCAALSAGALARFVHAGGDDGDRATAPPAAAAPASGTADGVAELEARTQRDPADAAAWQQLAVAYVRRAATVGDPSYYGLSAQALARAEDLAPDDAATAVARGTLELSRHEFADALESGQRALAQRPDDRDALAVVVDAQVELGRYDEAAATLQRLVDVRPTLSALARVSYLRELMGDVPGAVTAMQQAVAAGGGPAETATVVTFLGDLYWNSGRVEAAADEYARALRLAPGLVAAELGTARVEIARGERDAAVARLAALVERSPTPAAATLLGDLTGDDALARTTYALQEAAGGVVDLEAALFEADHGDPATALRRAEAAYGARRTIFTADALAWALHSAGRDADAVPYAEEALRLGTADALLHYHAAEIAAAVGDTTRARTEVAAALATNPHFDVVHAPAARALATRLGAA
jgi:tetratricopeptide (TPR) repeat protein